ncbi:MAG TPA: amidohydrolase family protein [Bacteroidia bacterium]|jgi:predicted TIM-barrel fold metal-dependent hydrolase|nr:amidohydrolase family protein [Bacteroidia bacterium]
MKYYNAHTHIFTAQYVPNNVVGLPIMNFLAQYPVAQKVAKVAKLLTFGRVNRSYERVAKFAEIGLGKSQEVIFEQLHDYYKGWGDVRFVILPMDMEQMGAGQPASNYYSQLDEIIRLRAKGNYANIILPFLFVDPRRPEFTNGKVLLEWVKPYFEKYGFIGIKMYPALGYYPFDEKLDELYAWAQETQVPILYHCIDGVIHYRGSLSGIQPPRFSSKFHNLKETDPAKYQWNFTEPDNYHHVLKMFPKLKINLAHYGGEDKIVPKARWYTTIRELVAGDNNVYTDVSFSLNDPRIFSTIHGDVNDAANKNLGEKILFGTDFYVVEKNKDEAYLRDELRSALDRMDKSAGIAISSFDRMASVNPTRFLTSDFYAG